jgi:hypothetical protein
VVPAGTAWARIAEKGDKNRWETVAQVGFEMTPEVYLDQMGTAVSKGVWRLAGQGPYFREFHSGEGGRSWTLRLSLAPSQQPGQYDLTATSASGRP